MGARPGSTNQVRIIGGSLRGRRLRFPDAAGLRPTADRVRETLFNWLQPNLPGARCLDLFAGSGALGFEAASRGAAEVLMIECQPKVVVRLRENLAALALPQVQILQQDALAWLAQGQGRFDLVFLDPPFADGLQIQVLAQLAGSPLLAPQGLIYVEEDSLTPPLVLPAAFSYYRQKRAGQVRFGLLQRVSADDA